MLYILYFYISPSEDLYYNESAWGAIIVWNVLFPVGFLSSVCFFWIFHYKDLFIKHLTHTHTHTHTHTPQKGTKSKIHVWDFIYIHTHTHTHTPQKGTKSKIHVWDFIYTHTHTHTHTHLKKVLRVRSMFGTLYIYTHTHTNAHIYVN